MQLRVSLMTIDEAVLLETYSGKSVMPMLSVGDPAHAKVTSTG